MFRAEFPVKKRCFTSAGFSFFFTPEKVGRERVLSGIEGLMQLNIFCSDLKPRQHDQESFLLRAATKINFEVQLISFVSAKCFTFVVDALRL